MTPSYVPMPSVDTATATATATADAGPKVKIEQLNQLHPWHKEMKDGWRHIDLMYEGGIRMERAAQLFLVRKAKELMELYNARCLKFSYQNILAQGLDWYVSYVFGTTPEVDCRARAAPGAAAKPGTVVAKPPEDEWYTDWRKNVDRKGTSDMAYFREAFNTTLRFESAWLLLDLPNPLTKARTRADQMQSGQLDSSGKPTPYLVLYDPRQVLNWAEDDDGNLTWVVIHTEGEQQVFLKKPLIVDRWYYFDRQTYQVWERKGPKGQLPGYAVKIDEGAHVLAEFNQVPIYRMKAPTGLWLANRVFTQAKEHLNQDNTYGWSLFNANLAMPVISGDMKENPTLAEAGYLKLPRDCTLSWTEPPGNSFAVSAGRLESLREEILRQMYLQYQARSQEATPAMQSGFSKQIEMMPASDIANRFGQTVRDAWEWVLNTLSRARGDDYVWEVRGLEFTQSPVLTEVETATVFKELGVPSRTAEKENYAAAALVRFRNLNATLKEKIAAEIEAAPTDDERAAQQQQEAAQYGMAAGRGPGSAGPGSGPGSTSIGQRIVNDSVIRETLQGG